ncbi:DUF6960 family protein [Zophobihabitans entericus]|uniref:Uncharacterized protein n=1 Tax=Zophobihabitans entericus TaxID=1635327 RepID=A0A6G9IB02_9GAMM|nr:hypothetical protein [Zophobihabitans entericus]QIQ21406.1 hypothetical protein IPMB12_06715 [Zophobihabitans entericus]
MTLKYRGTYGLYPWFPDDDETLIHANDLQKVKAFSINGLYGYVFYCSDENADFIELSYGDFTFKVKPDLYSTIPSIQFHLGEHVAVIGVSEKKGVIVSIKWHSKYSKPMYFLSFNGRKSSRRYFDTELVEYYD